MKKWFFLFLTLCLCVSLSALAETAAPKLSYPSQELDMPAAGLMIYVPTNMDTLDSDEESFDLGFRFNCYTDTFDFTVYVHDSRDMSLPDYAAFYANRYGFIAAADRINGFAVQRLTKPDKPRNFDILVAMPDEESPEAVYALSFSCGNDADQKLADEILSTLALYGYE